MCFTTGNINTILVEFLVERGNEPLLYRAKPQDVVVSMKRLAAVGDLYPCCAASYEIGSAPDVQVTFTMDRPGPLEG